MDRERFAKLQSDVNNLSTMRLLELLVSICTTLQWRFTRNHLREVVMASRDALSGPEGGDEHANEGSTVDGSTRSLADGACRFSSPTFKMFLKHAILKRRCSVADSTQLLDTQKETQPTAHLRRK